MVKKLRIVLAQLNLHVGDIEGNLRKHMAAVERAKTEFHADIIVFPELSLTGYPAEDLLLRPDFIEQAHAASQEMLAKVQDIYCVFGSPHQTPQGLQNTCSLIHNGRLLGRYAKQILPNYGVFDEQRYFAPGRTTCVIPIEGIPVGILICEDLWHSGPLQQAAHHGARVILAPNASPFEIEKHEQRVALLAHATKENHLPIAYVNCIGGQDDLIFDGGSMVVDEQGHIAKLANFFAETLLPIDIAITPTTSHITPHPISIPTQAERIYQSLILGVRDYIAKNHFTSVLVGVSGGIDSALTLTIAVDALGKEKVHAVFMPSRYSADISKEEAVTLAKNLDVPLQIISIESTYQAFLNLLAPAFTDKSVDITEQNIQARCRAIILMALSNKFGHLVLTTGNRSEMAVGYATLYGDMAGGFAVLKDVPKTLVYQLAAYRNQHNTVIPQRTIERAPTAELAPHQKDEDSLPPYPVLDAILNLYLNHAQSAADIIAQNFDPAIVHKVIALIRKNEYKRRQSAIGTRINHFAFGRDRRYPVTSGFKG
jgi:NAD+ synthase (glutamine-hydrolysing)